MDYENASLLTMVNYDYGPVWNLEARLGSFRLSFWSGTWTVQRFLNAWMSGHICLRAAMSPILGSELQAGQELQSIPGNRRKALFKWLSSHQTLGFCAMAYPAIQNWRNEWMTDDYDSDWIIQFVHFNSIQFSNSFQNSDQVCFSWSDLPTDLQLQCSFVMSHLYHESWNVSHWPDCGKHLKCEHCCFVFIPHDSQTQWCTETEEQGNVIFWTVDSGVDNSGLRPPEVVLFDWQTLSLTLVRVK